MLSSTKRCTRIWQIKRQSSRLRTCSAKVNYYNYAIIKHHYKSSSSLADVFNKWPLSKLCFYSLHYSQTNSNTKYYSICPLSSVNKISMSHLISHLIKLVQLTLT